MISAHEAIQQFRRGLTLSSAVKVMLWACAAVVLSLHFFTLPRMVDPTLLLMILGLVWMMLWHRTMKGSRMAAHSSSLIASGQLDLAERQIADALRAFSMSRSIKSMSMLNLALVRLAQRRWPDVALICREITGGPPPIDSVNRSGRLLLADSLLEMGDLRGAHDAISGLYQSRLSLPEALNLLRVQVEYLARIGAWPALLEGLPTRLELAELMPAGHAARVQAFLALGAKKMGKIELSAYLRRRVELLADVQELAKVRPALWELWQKPDSPAPGEAPAPAQE